MVKQLFVLNAPKSTSASRQKSEANLGRNIASLVGVGVFLFYKSSTSNSEAHLSPPLGNRPLVEEREEFFALSREEEKAV